MIRSNSQNQFMVLIQFFENNKDEIKLVMNYLKNSFKEISSLLYVINDKDNDSIYDRETVLYDGKSYIEEKINARLIQIAQTANMPGFRPGKVPVSLLKKTHGQAIMGEMLEKTVNESSQEVITEKELRPVSQPKIEIKKFFCH